MPWKWNIRGKHYPPTYLKSAATPTKNWLTVMIQPLHASTESGCKIIMMSQTHLFTAHLSIVAWVGQGLIWRKILRPDALAFSRMWLLIPEILKSTKWPVITINKECKYHQQVLQAKPWTVLSLSPTHMHSCTQKHMHTNTYTHIHIHKYFKYFDIMQSDWLYYLAIHKL